MRWEGHRAWERREMRYKFSVGKTEYLVILGTIGIPTLRMEDNIRMVIRETRW